MNGWCMVMDSICKKMKVQELCYIMLGTDKGRHRPAMQLIGCSAIEAHLTHHIVASLH